MRFTVTHLFPPFHHGTFKGKDSTDTDGLYWLPRPSSFHSLLIVNGLGKLATLSECNTLTVISSWGDQETHSQSGALDRR